MNDPTKWLDPAVLEQVRQMLAPTEEQKRMARAQAIMAAGFSMIGAPKSRAWEAVGRAGQIGAGVYGDQMAQARDAGMQQFQLADYFNKRQREEEEYKRQKALREAKEKARAASVIPARQAVEPFMGEVDESLDAGLQPGTPATPQTFDYQTYADMVAAVDPQEALAVRAATAKTGGWHKVGPAPGGGDLYVGPDGKPEVVGKQGEVWEEIGRQGDGILLRERYTRNQKWVGNPAPRVSVENKVSVPGQQQRSEFEKARGKDLATEYDKLQTAARTSGTELQKLGALEALLAGINTSSLTPVGVEIAGALAGFGINIDPKLPQKQAADAISKEMALQLRNPAGGAGMPGALSDKDREFLVKMTPGIGMTPEGRRILIEVRRRLALRNQEVARLAREYVKVNGGQYDDGFEDYLARSGIAERDLFADLMVRTPPKGAGPAASGTIGGPPASSGRAVPFNQAFPGGQ